jgi:uncharacterized membrane protein
MRKFLSDHGFLLSLAYLTLVSCGFFAAGAISNRSLELWYFIWNLFLSWLPLLFALWLIGVLKRKPWSSWQGVTLSLLWLFFLPNSFYMVSDYIHLQDYQRVNIVYDTLMFSAFILTSLMLGYTSLYLVHRELMRRLKTFNAWLWVSGVLVLCSYAIYLGRDLRWNTWDVLVNPAGILFDVSETVLHPTDHYLALTTTVTFSVFLGSLYFVLWQLAHALPRQRR